MALYMNEMGEFVDPYEPKPLLKLKPVGEEAMRPAKGPRAFGREPRKCAECGKEFVPRNREHTFCCKACGERNRRRRR